MQDQACALYSMTGMFFTTNAGQFILYPREEDYNPATPAVGQGADDEGTDDDDDPEKNLVLGPAVHPVVIPATLIERLRLNAFESCRKTVELQKVDEQKLWPLMWSRMSTGSKSKVRKEPGYEDATRQRAAMGVHQKESSHSYLW